VYLRPVERGCQWIDSPLADSRPELAWLGAQLAALAAIAVGLQADWTVAIAAVPA
jgi:hypothetical protein